MSYGFFSNNSLLLFVCNNKKEKNARKKYFLDLSFLLFPIFPCFFLFSEKKKKLKIKFFKDEEGKLVLKLQLFLLFYFAKAVYYLHHPQMFSLLD